MHCPGKEEEPSRVVKARSSTYKVSMILSLGHLTPTIIERIHTTTERQLISRKDTSINGKKTASEPPTNRVSEEVDLLLGIGLRPETDTSQQEWPYEWLAGIGMAASQSIVVVEHRTLQLEPLC